jgi:Ecdysteroid kinase-like family
VTDGRAEPDPRSAAQLSTEWLTSVLRSSGFLAMGEVVRSFATEVVGTGQMADTVRISLITDSDVVPHRSVIAKFSSGDEASRSTGSMSRAYEIEVSFYRQVARGIRCRVPDCLYASFDPDTGWSVILLQDVPDAQTTAQLEGCTRAEAGAAVVEMARLHGSYWADAELAAMEWLNRRSGATDQFLASLLTSVWPGFLERYADRLDPAHLRLCERFVAGIGQWLAGVPPGKTVVHGDFRLDNLLYRPDDARPFVVDWQTTSWGCAVADLAYFLGGSLTIEERRRSESVLTDLYHHELLEQGIDYGKSQLHADVRSLCLGGLILSIGAPMLVKRTERGDDLFVTSVTRYAQQALDLEAEPTARASIIGFAPSRSDG